MSPNRTETRGGRPSLVRILLVAHVLGLLAVSAWFRCRSLGNIPGLNGDEASYGIQALRVLGEGQFPVQTPSGNPYNPFFLAPMVLLHAVFDPSIAVLRSVAVGSGLVALAVNWWLCCRVLDRRTAAISTVLLAILPINIAYSRFAWDASQTLATTLPVLYCSLGAARFGQHAGRWVAGAIVALIVAVWVHPTNIFAGAALVAVFAARFGRDDLERAWIGGGRGRAVLVGLSVTVVILLALLALWLQTPAAGRFVRRVGDVRELVWPEASPHFTILFARLLVGGTVYRCFAGSASWLEWPALGGRDGFGPDVVLFWAALAAAVWCLRRSWKATGRTEDRVLATGWVLGLAAWLLLAGPHGMTPGWERYAMCLVGPTVVLLARGAAVCLTVSARAGQLALGAASLLGWLVLADFDAHYFRFIAATGGRADATYRTADVEPKVAALRAILEHRTAGTTWIASSQWNVDLPLYYLAMAHPDVRVVPEEHFKPFVAPLQETVPWDEVWYVEFARTEGLREVEARLGARPVRRWPIPAYDGRPVLWVVHGE